MGKCGFEKLYYINEIQIQTRRTWGIPIKSITQILYILNYLQLMRSICKITWLSSRINSSLNNLRVRQVFRKLVYFQLKNRSHHRTPQFMHSLCCMPIDNGKTKKPATNFESHELRKYNLFTWILFFFSTFSTWQLTIVVNNGVRPLPVKVTLRLRQDVEKNL